MAEPMPQVTPEHREAAARARYGKIWAHMSVIHWRDSGERNGGISDEMVRIAQAISDAEARALRSATAEIERLKAGLDSLPEHFSLSVFAGAGLPLAQASTALMVARRVLEDAEGERSKAATVSDEQQKCGPGPLVAGQCARCGELQCLPVCARCHDQLEAGSASVTVSDGQLAADIKDIRHVLRVAQAWRKSHQALDRITIALAARGAK